MRADSVTQFFGVGMNKYCSPGSLTVCLGRPIVGSLQRSANVVISGNTLDGLRSYMAIDIRSGYFGVGSDGLTPVGNGAHGIRLDPQAANSRIGGEDQSALRVVASGNADADLLEIPAGGGGVG